MAALWIGIATVGIGATWLAAFAIHWHLRTRDYCWGHGEPHQFDKHRDPFTNLYFVQCRRCLYEDYDVDQASGVRRRDLLKSDRLSKSIRMS